MDSIDVIKDLIAASGPGLLIPVVLFALLFYAVRGLFGLHGRRSQHRREFLEHWDPKRVDDDLWLEVTIRHLYGKPLPAHVIRTALSHPHASQALLDLSELWSFLDYDPETRSVSWQHKWHRNRTTRGALRHWPVVRYFLFALTSMAAAYYATRVEGISQWAFAALALIMGAAAFLSLWHSDAEKVAARTGEAWIERINATSTPHPLSDNAT
ncbi:hypothetical protein [Luteimonas sp. RC10]|uniref:hypothetical protein n=1 Tax=Luteimonas sp. RC10 TaxID=2587035 RepID=UPI0016113C21|nr:hypothetical protein [Luteimonas sp. RC10]MBB3344756.1 hypothetical protein [Luteimonas sp. RC10]